MKKLNYLLVSLFLLLGIGTATADVVNNYKVDFNTSIATSDHNFKVATGWNHKSESAYLDYTTEWVEYTYRSNGGVDNSGSLLIGSQTLSSGYYYSEEQEVHDYLITPQVSGKVTLMVKRGEYSHFLQVYKATPNGNGTFSISADTLDLTVGNTTTKSYEKFVTDSFTQVTIGNFTEPTYLAIRGSGIVIDDFSADKADVNYVRALKIDNQTVVNSSPDTRPDGKFPITLALRLENTGDYDLNVGDTDYTVTVYVRDDSTVIGTVPISKPVARGATIRDTITVYANYTDYPKNTAYKVRENVSGTSYEYQTYIQPVAYAPILSARYDGSSLSSGGTISFGLLNASKSEKVLLSNDGAKEMNITSITAPDGFSVNKNAFTIAPHSTDTLTITASVANVGIHEGNLVINADELDPFNIKLISTVLDSTKYFVDFENGHMPAGVVPSSNWSVVSWIGDNKYVLENGSVVESLFITPLLKVKEGDKFSFDAGRRSGATLINVYYSTDRKNWIKADSIPADSLPYNSLGGSYGNYKYALKTFVIDNIPAGNYYLAFGAGYAHIDNLYGYELVPVAHDLMVSSQKVPYNGEVNTQFNASFSVRNIGVNDEAEGSYTATFHFGSESVPVKSVKLEAGTISDFSLAYTPHKAGKFPAYFELRTNDGYVLTSDTVNVNVVNEIASNVVTVGKFESNNTAAPLNLNFKNSETVTVYTADMLKDLANGAKITSLQYRGYASGYYARDINTDSFRVWIANTTEEPAKSPYPAIDTTNMTKVYDGKYMFHCAGNSSQHLPIIDITLAEPFVYTGGNIRVVVRSLNQDTYTSTSFEATNEQGHAYGRRNDSYDSFLAGSYSSTYTPVVYFGVERDPIILSGTVKDLEGNPVPGAVVKLTNNNIEYSDTADAEGKYNINIIRNSLKYELRTDVTGYEPYIIDSVSVDSSYTQDIVLKTATGLFVENYSIPATGAVNSQCSASITLTNDIATAIGADEYTVKLFVDGKEVSEAKDKSGIAVGGKTTITLPFIPHAAGKFPAYIKAEYNGHETATSGDSITIAEEEFGGLVTVGDSTEIGSRNNPATPWNNWYKLSQSVNIYTADMINLPKGSVITRIAYRGTLGSATAGKEAADFFIANTNSELTSDNVDTLFADTASMTRLLDSRKDTISYGGNSEYSKVHDVLSINIPGGFVYEGGNILLVFDGNHKGQSDNKISYVVDSNKKGYAFGRATDYGSLSSTKFDSEDAMPVLYLTIVSRKTASGTVIDKKTKQPVANASVLFDSNGVQYSGTTDAQGKYSVDVAKAGLTYNAIFSAEGYITDTVKNVTFDSGDSIVVNDTIAPVPTVVGLSGTVKGAQRHAGGTIDEAQPLAGATVTVADDKNVTVASATTAADGTYAVDSLTEGTAYTVTFSAEGYTDSVLTVTAPDTNFVADATLLSEKVKSNVTGTVKGIQRYSNKENDEPVVLLGATVTVTLNGNAVATATTDAEGKYTIENLSEDSVYTFTFAASGYSDSTATVTAGAEDKVVDATLYSEAIATTIEGIIAQSGSAISDGIAHGNVYTIGGQFIGREVDVKSLGRGVYIIGGKKITIK